MRVNEQKWTTSFLQLRCQTVQLSSWNVPLQLTIIYPVCSWSHWQILLKPQYNQYAHCSTSAETRDRKCFNVQLILVMGNWVRRVWSIRFARCYHFVESYCQLILLKKWLLSTLLSTVVTAKCSCVRNTNVCFFQCRHASQVGQHFNLRLNFEL